MLHGPTEPWLRIDYEQQNFAALGRLPRSGARWHLALLSGPSGEGRALGGSGKRKGAEEAPRANQTAARTHVCWSAVLIACSAADSALHSGGIRAIAASLTMHHHITICLPNKGGTCYEANHNALIPGDVCLSIRPPCGRWRPACT